MPVSEHEQQGDPAAVRQDRRWQRMTRFAYAHFRWAPVVLGPLQVTTGAPGTAPRLANGQAITAGHVESWRRAAPKNPDSLFAIAILKQTGHPAVTDTAAGTSGETLLRALAKAGHVPARLCLANTCGSKSLLEERTWRRWLAQNTSGAYPETGVLLANLHLVAYPNSATARRRMAGAYEQAARHGDANAQFALAYAHVSGGWVDINFSEAEAVIRRYNGIPKRLSDVMLLLGFLQEMKGKRPAAGRLYEAAAIKGQAHAAYMLGQLNEELAKELPPGPERAAALTTADHWLERAAGQQHVGAAMILADRTAPSGPTPAPEQHLEYCRLASLSGDAERVWALARLYHPDTGYQPDPERWAKLVAAAAARGVKEAKVAQAHHELKSGDPLRRFAAQGTLDELAQAGNTKAKDALQASYQQEREQAVLN